MRGSHVLLYSQVKHCFFTHMAKWNIASLHKYGMTVGNKWCLQQLPTILILTIENWAAAWQNWQNQRRLRSAWASAQPDLSLGCVLNRKQRAQAFFMRKVKTDQTGRIPRLIWIFTGRMGHFVGFVIRRLKWDQIIWTPETSIFGLWKSLVVFWLFQVCVKR